MKAAFVRCAGVLAVAARVGASDVLHVPGDYPTIQGAIDAALDLDEVVVAPGLYEERIDFLGKAIVVRSSDGAAVTTINAQGAGTVVVFQDHEGRDSGLQGFTITGGDAPAGGGILCMTASPSIRDCVITGNSAASGAGLFAGEGGILVERCTFERNTASGQGGGLWLGCCPANNMPSEFIDCAFLDNTASPGGGMYSTGGWFEFRGCSFTGNDGGQSGGAVALDMSGGNLFEGCEFIGNLATGGGAISQLNEAEATLRACTFRENYADTDGGAILASATSFPIYAFDCAFETNQAGGQGGAVVSIGAGFDLTRCTFDGNSAGKGGALAIDQFSIVASVAGGSFTSNSAGLGGAIYHEYLPLTISDATLAANTAGAGGGIYSFYAADEVSRCTFDANNASSGGGLYAVNGWGTLADCVFTDNAAGKGGGACVDEIDGHVFDRCTFEHNSGAGLYSFFSAPRIEDSAFRNHPGPGVEAVDNEYGFHPFIGATEFCGNSPDIAGSYYDTGGNTFAPWCECLPDWNADGALNTQDVIAYLNDWVAKDPGADLTGDGLVDTRDFLAFLNLWAAGC